MKKYSTILYYNSLSPLSPLSVFCCVIVLYHIQKGLSSRKDFFLIYFIKLYIILYSLLYFLYTSVNVSYGIPNKEAISDLVLHILEANLKQASLQIYGRVYHIGRL